MSILHSVYARLIVFPCAETSGLTAREPGSSACPSRIKDNNLSESFLFLGFNVWRRANLTEKPVAHSSGIVPVRER